MVQILLMLTVFFTQDSEIEDQGPVVQSIVSLTSSLRGQLVKYYTTLLLKTLKLFVEKMREAFAPQKLLKLFQQKILAKSRY